jgi:hypothetical protein
MGLLVIDLDIKKAANIFEKRPRFRFNIYYICTICHTKKLLWTRKKRKQNLYKILRCLLILSSENLRSNQNAEVDKAGAPEWVCSLLLSVAFGYGDTSDVLMVVKVHALFFYPSSTLGFS